MADLFGDDRYQQTRVNRKPVCDDRAFYETALKLIYDAGPDGISMHVLLRVGVKRGWWQDTAGKHWGEKMRMLWAFGVLTVPMFPGSAHTKTIRVIHPAYAVVSFESETLNRQHDRLIQTLKGRADV